MHKLKKSATPYDLTTIESQVKTSVSVCKPGTRTTPIKDFFPYASCPADSMRMVDMNRIPRGNWCACDTPVVVKQKLISKAENAEERRVSDLKDTILYRAIFFGFVVWVSSFAYLKHKLAKSALALNRARRASAPEPAGR